MRTSSSLKPRDRQSGFTKSRWPVGLSLGLMGLAGLVIIFVGWALVGWPVLVAAAVAAMVVRFA